VEGPALEVLRDPGQAVGPVHPEQQHLAPVTEDEAGPVPPLRAGRAWPAKAGRIVSVPVPRAVAVVVDGRRALVIKRYLRSASARTCVMCAALRELREETTLTARIDRLLWTGQHTAAPRVRSGGCRRR
jgi:hypothetical protein